MADRDLLMRVAEAVRRECCDKRLGAISVGQADLEFVVNRVIAERPGLPVMPTCGQCIDCYPPERGWEDRGQVCAHPSLTEAGPRIARDKPPPEWCPLRK